jgi:hypothetical protein
MVLILAMLPKLAWKLALDGWVSVMKIHRLDVEKD